MKQLNTINAMMDGVIVFGQDGLIAFANHPACAMLGYACDELMGRNVDMLMSEAFRPSCADGHRSERLQAIRKDGSAFPVAIQLSPMAIGDAALHCLSLQDMSQQAAEAAKREQSQKFEALGEMVSGIAHNFNNVIAGIAGQAYLLEQDEMFSDKGQSRMQLINTLCSQAAGIIHQLMLYARQQNDEHCDVRLADMLRDVAMIANITASENISIHVQTDTNDLSMHGSANQIQQTLLNLVNNAIYAIGEAEGDITITAKHCTGSDCHFTPCQVERSQADSLLCIQVCDNGQGIAPQHLHRIFDPFFTTKQTGHGTGLGLSTSYGIIKKHGGEISVSSKPGKGSTFQLYLPVAKGQGHAEQEVKALNPVLTRQAESILIIDDEPSICSMLADIIAGFGYSALTAADGMQGVEVFTRHQHEIALVLSDISMPKLDGREVLSMIRAIKPDVPFLFITGYEGNAMEWFEGCDNTNVMLKPFDFVRLSHEVHRLVHGYEM